MSNPPFPAVVSACCRAIPNFCNLPLSSLQSFLCFASKRRPTSGMDHRPFLLGTPEFPLFSPSPATPPLYCQHLRGCGYFLHKYKHALNFNLRRKGDRNISLDSTFSPFSLSPWPSDANFSNFVSKRVHFTSCVLLVPALSVLLQLFP